MKVIGSNPTDYIFNNTLDAATVKLIRPMYYGMTKSTNILA